jgi:hypothetical protein
LREAEKYFQHIHYYKVVDSTVMYHEFLTVQIRSAIYTYDKVPHGARVELLVASS